MSKTIFENKEQYIWSIIRPLMQWAEEQKYQSYDWWDIWGTKIGGYSKSLYFRNKLLGAPLVASIMLLDLIYPGFRKSFVQKRVFPICHAHFGLGYLNLYEITREPDYLEKAKRLVDPLLFLASPQVDGLGWGMNHEWMTIQGLIPSRTPCNTQTAYAYEFFVKLYELTGKQCYRDYLGRIAQHVANDFTEWHIGNGLVCSYSTIDQRQVVNANSYRMYMMLDAGVRFSNEIYLNKGLATLRYVLSKQNKDGSWPYSEDQPFVDNYHTSFVIKNLHKARQILKKSSSEIDGAIQKGLDFYFSKLLDNNGYPVPFFINAHMTLCKYDSYDVAEIIGLLADLNIEHERLLHIIRFARNKFQKRKGWFIFRIYPCWSLKGISYMRYANSAMFFALTKVYKLIMGRYGK